MPREFSRTQRIADQIQRDLSEIMQQEMRDPRLGMVTINEVKVSRDLGYADIYVTFMGIEESADSYQTAIKVLNRAASYLRTCLSKILNTRTTPSLRFHYDEALEKSRYITALINQTIAQDTQSKDIDNVNLNSNKLNIDAKKKH